MTRAVALPADARLRGGARLALAAEILRAYVVVRRAMARADVKAVLAELRAVPVATPAADPVRAARRLGRATVRTLRVLPTDSRCLMRSLVLVRLLARRGVDATLVLGVTGTAGFAAHAWVEVAGAPVLPDGPGFERLTEL